MNSRHPDGPNAPQAQRAQRLRRALAGNDLGSQARFAARIGVPQSRWSNVERGYPISRSLGNLMLRAFPGLSLDWLEHGHPQGLSVDLWQKLAQVDRDDSAENASTGR